MLTLRPLSDAEAGLFTLTGDERANPVGPAEFSGPDSLALLLHTSGTTARPKLVPLTHANLCASAGNVASHLQLAPSDRCLNIMPLFHIHGLVAAVLASLLRGASVVCTTGFEAPRFFDWLSEFEPTGYTAVPTMHQAILERALLERVAQREIPRSSLRLIRSSSAALPPRVMAALESVFGVPVIEAYGMTEASHQMAGNPLPPDRRKPGSVGLAVGTEIAIMDDGGNLLPTGIPGEVVIRGANVTAGYEADRDANQAPLRMDGFTPAIKAFWIARVTSF